MPAKSNEYPHYNICRPSRTFGSNPFNKAFFAEIKKIENSSKEKIWKNVWSQNLVGSIILNIVLTSSDKMDFRSI